MGRVESCGESMECGKIGCSPRIPVQIVTSSADKRSSPDECPLLGGGGGFLKPNSCISGKKYGVAAACMAKAIALRTKGAGSTVADV